jgi:hypothetical protein
MNEMNDNTSNKSNKLNTLNDLIDVQDMTESSTTRVEKTPYKKTEFTGRIEAVTKPGLERSCRKQGGVATSVSLVNGYIESNAAKYPDLTNNKTKKRS